MLTMETLQPLLAEVPANPPVRTSDTALMLDALLDAQARGPYYSMRGAIKRALVLVWREATSLQLMKPNHESLQHNHHSLH